MTAQAPAEQHEENLRPLSPLWPLATAGDGMSADLMLLMALLEEVRGLRRDVRSVGLALLRGPSL